MPLKLNENERIEDKKLIIEESFLIKPKVNQRQIVDTTISESKGGDSGKRIVLKPKIECIHAGRTRNDNIYRADKLKGDPIMNSGVHSFLFPYPKPMLKNHDTDSEPTGRITNAQFISDTASGQEGIIIIPEISDPDTIEKVLDGRYMTVSIGASTDSARCNICGTDILEEGWCGHERGQTYDGVKCGWIVGNLWFNECSWVTVPADENAIVTDAGEPIAIETYAQVGEKFFNLSAEDAGRIEVKESAARLLGLSTEGGTNEVKLAEELEAVKAELQQEKEAKAGLETQVSDLTEQVAAKDGVIAEKDTAITEKDAAITQKDTELATANEALEAANTTIQEKDTKITELEAGKTSVEEENTNLTGKVTELSASLHKSVAERVVDMKIVLGKIKEEDREKELEAHVTRTKESLEDSLKDLLGEAKKSNVWIQTAITNPGIGAVPGEPNAKINGVNSKPEVTKEQVLTNLFSGKYRS